MSGRESSALHLRLPASLSERLDALVRVRQAARPHMPISRSAVVRELLAAAIESVERGEAAE